MARPSKLTDDLTHKLAALFRNGNYVTVACDVVGIDSATYYRWLKAGEHDLDAGLDTPHARFCSACVQARAEGEATLLTRIQLAAPTDWRAAAWILERTRPTRYGPRQQFEVAPRESLPDRDGPADTPLDDARLDEVARILRDTGALGPDSGEVTGFGPDGPVEEPS